MDNEKLQEEVISQIRACLVSTKGKCDLRQIRNDYRMLMGSEIPHVRLGFKTLEQFICSIPSLSTTRINGQLLVDAKVTEKSSHISNFIDKQKTGKKKMRPPARQVPNYNFRGPARPQWRPKNTYSQFKKSYQSSPRPAAVSHNQFVNISPSPKPPPNLPPRLASRLNIREESVPKAPPPEDIENYPDLFFKNTKKRLTKKMEVMNIEDSTTNGGGVTPGDWIKMERALDNSYLSSSEIQELQRESMAAVDLDSSVWKWSSSDDSPEKGNGVPVVRRNTNNTTEPMILTGDSLADLYTFTKAHMLGEPVIKITSRKVKKKPVCYDCVIRVGSEKRSSYPDDCLEESVAKQIAAKRLLEELMPKYGKRKSLLISNDGDILERIPPIVKLHHNGVWNWQLEADYVEKFNEQLPVNWIEVVDSNPCISVQPILNNFVLLYCKPNEVFQKGNLLPFIVANVSVPSNTVKFDGDGLLVAEITCPASAGEIWCRQIETPESEAFINMSIEMEDYYTCNHMSERVGTINMAGYYVAHFDNMWCRVRIIGVNANDMNCFCIDFGDEWIVPKDDIFLLNRQFAKEQAQAFVCRLNGVEELYEESKTSDYFNNLVGKVVQVQVDPCEKTDPNDPALSVVLYDAETGIIINEHLIDRIGIESALPTLNQNTPTEVYVTHALDNGSVYVQVQSKGYDQLMRLLRQEERNILNGGPELPAPVDQPNETDLYFVQDNNCWYRAQIVDWSPDRKYAQLFLVDYGRTIIVKVAGCPFYLLSDLGDVISKFPHQALKVRMAINKLPADLAQKITSLMPPDEPVLVKLLMTDPEMGPLVEFFKRSNSDNDLFSVNTALSAETDSINAFDDGNNNSGKTPITSAKLKRLISIKQFDDTGRNVPSSGSLSCPPLPKVGEFLDVKIPCAVHPHNFFVQPYESQDKLVKLMATLQEKYKDVYFSPIQIHDVLPGNIYASRHEDGMWYRTSVIKVIHSGSISVFYCDFGYYANLTLHQLVPLSSELTDLPHQAIKAKLAGIEPKNSKWTMDDCKFFESLVCRKSFVSILVGIEKDVLYRSDTVLSLKLIDTSTNIDVHIDKVLIKEGIAVELDM